MKKLLFAAIASIVLVGCSHNLTIVGRDAGQTGSGVADGIQSGTLTVTLNNKTYTGDWVSAMEGFSGQGSALLSAKDGSRLHCEFTADHFSGYGTCEDDKKKIYDVQIH
ncbi:MAG: hypothetical protein WCD70_11270 [Alphaproteobacteria bacterium]